MSAQALRKDEPIVSFPSKAAMKRAEEGTLIYFVPAAAQKKQAALRDLSALDEMYAYFGSDEDAR